jgi:hypothetical protein
MTITLKRTEHREHGGSHRYQVIGMDDHLLTSLMELPMSPVVEGAQVFDRNIGDFLGRLALLGYDRITLKITT